MAAFLNLTKEKLINKVIEIEIAENCSKSSSASA